uniref:C2 domain-containing protein n=1 Tax=Ciona savignyi TaxID=51511 RepID=H2ZAE5_CIOSA
KVEDFQIRLKVICARQLTGSNIKPVVKVKAGKNQAKITRIRKGSAPIWNELLMFNFNESLKELYDYVFEFALNNSRKLRSDALIGSFKLDVGTIYDQPGHAFVRKWLLLTDPDDASNSPKGYLKITVCVLGAGDQPPVTGKDDDNDDVEGNLLTPAGASLRAATFTLRVYGAEDLPQMDSGSLKSMKQRIGLGEEGDITKTLVDPFLSFIFAGKKRKTQIIKETNQPEWNEELNLPLKFPSMCDSIKLTIKDWDRIGSDDPIGTVIIPLSRISSTGEEANGAGFPPTFGPSFVNFYGSPREFSKLGDSLDDLNIGKASRAMVELVTTMDEEGAEPAPPSQPINDDQIALVKKYMRRRRYRLVVGFESANMIRKPLERIEFEVSIGNYGNKFDTEVGAASSTTEPGNPVFDDLAFILRSIIPYYLGVNYHYMAWTSKKPILMVTSQWEDISFRLYAMNLILRTCERMEGQINHLNELVKVEADEIEIASEIVSILDMLILETSKKLPDPRGRTASNQLDRRIHRQRLQTFVAICEEAKDLRQNCTDAQEAISAINDFLERLKLVSYEPQNSLPDVVVWMISDNKRIAYARIPAYEILYSPEKPEFCGRYCAKPCTITLKYPTANAKSKKHYKVPAQLRIIAWLGRAADQDSFEFHSRFYFENMFHVDSAKKSKKIHKIPTPKIYIVYKDVSKLHLRAYIYQGRDLLPMDQDSFSDPVVMVSFLNQTHRTEVQQHTLNPVWDQTLMIDIQFYGDLEHLQRNCPDVLCEVFDKDDLGSLEFMGRTSGKPLLQFDPEEDETPRLQWLNIRKANQAGGNILAAFELILVTVPIVGKHKYPIVFVKTPSFHCTVPDIHVPMVPCGIRPVLQRTAIEFLVWGVRDMQSFQLLSVDSPSVLIQIGEVEIRTKIIKSLKKNPNFAEPIYYLEANLPVDDLYFPPIVIRVKDNRKFGRRPTVGQHIITNSISYRIKPPPEESQSDEGYGSLNIDGKYSFKLLAFIIWLSYVPEMTYEIETVKVEFEESKMESISEDDEATPLLKFHEYTKVQYTSADAAITILDSDDDTMNEIDWWSKFYASIGESGMAGNYVESGLDLIKVNIKTVLIKRIILCFFVYTNELEKQENFKHFGDFIQTFRLFRGKGVLEDEEPDFAGQFKGTFRIYTLPEDKREPNPPKFFQNVPPTDVVEVKVRIYVIRAFELAPQDSNGLADPYLKIKVGKKRIVDRDNYIPNSLSPTFGRMFELELKLPMEKDLHVEVFDWDLIGTDDKIGETVIDLENRYLSKFKAWCALPETYCISGPCPWRDQMRPKEWLEHKCRQEKWDEPVWNSNTYKVKEDCFIRSVNFKILIFCLKKACEHWGDADERLALYILRTFPHVSEHVETRPLFYDALPNIEQGRLQLWVDMFPKEYGDPGLPYNIEPRKPSKYFLRMIVWNCSEIPMMDVSMLGDKMSDIYFKGWISGLEHKRQKTDVHYRSLDGTGNFNWRFVFPFDYLPQERMVHVSKKEHLWSLDKTVTKFPPVLNIQVWDNDLFGPNEYISEIILPITNMPKCCKFQRFCTLENVPDMQGNCKMEMLNLFDQNTPLKGWWPLYKVVDGVREQAGKLEMSVEIVSEEEEVEKPAGQGRDEPNMNPKLEKPNRPATSFAWFSSPFKSLRYIIWRKYKWIILGVLGVLVLAAFIVLFIYSFP